MRKSSIPGDQPLSQPPRLRLATQDIERLSTVPPNRYQEANLDLPAPPFSSLKPRMILFREVMRDEAGYSAFISATCAISAVLGFVAIKRQILWAPTGWLGMNWALMSALAIHSFGRVVHRHEEEAMFRNPAYWDPMLNTDLETSRTFQLIDPRRPPSFIGGPHRRPVRHVDSFDSGTYTFPDSYKFGEGSYQSYRVDHSIPPKANDRQSWEESSSSEPREKERNRTSSYASPYPSPLGTVVHEDASHGWSRDVPIGLVAMETRTDESNALDTSTSSGHADSIPDYCIPSPQRNLPDR
ncbi:hypothetical protein EWM64_g4211 [Hericium alpestre]|uniref:Transmembrane protein n=1 Tax=Hericium alpestre TaxID=135208 RepID=A0A4Z0A048_9AGAM|nr:hypothetical protein EWM64_g4211 [Hericium alpestre]